MSASREKKTRQDQTGVGRNDPRTAREAQQRKEERRSNILYILIAIAFVAVGAVSITWNSNIIQKGSTAATVDGEKYGPAAVSYYYENLYQSFLNDSYSYLSMLGLDPQGDPKTQTINETAVSFLPMMGMPAPEEGQTWHDYFLNQALEQLAHTKALCDAAEADGFTWNDEMQAEMDNAMDTLTSTAGSYGYTDGQYLNMVFGPTMTKSAYKDQLRASIIAENYTNSYTDSLVYTTEELDAAYNENVAAYEVASADYVSISGSAPSTTDEEGNEVEPTEEEQAAAMAAAEEAANEILAAYRNGGDLETLAGENDAARYTHTDTIQAGDAVLNAWLFDDARQAGDAAVLEDEGSSTYYVAVFHSRGRQAYNTVDVRHILIQPEQTTLSSEDEGYQADVDAKKAEAKAKADDILAQWQAGEATEDSFAQLARENSSDGNAAEGGLYEQVYQGQMVDTFNDWCFDPARQSGDTGVVETTYGYHVMYFVGQDRPYWEIRVENDLKTEATNTWYAEKTEGATAEQGSGIQYVG